MTKHDKAIILALLLAHLVRLTDCACLNACWQQTIRSICWSRRQREWCWLLSMSLSYLLGQMRQSKPWLSTWAAIQKSWWYAAKMTGSLQLHQVLQRRSRWWSARCSAGSLASIAHGLSDNLIERAADVVMKERGQLLLVVRETPFSTLHLENMHKLSTMGVTVMPAAPFLSPT